MFGMPAAPAPADVEAQLPAGADSVSSLRWHPGGAMLAAGSWDNKVRVWEVARGGMGGAPSGAAGKAEKDVGAPVLDVEWRDDGAAAFAVGCGKTVKLWSLATDQVVDVGSHDAPIKSAFWVKEKQFLVTGGWDKTIRYWDTRTPTPQFTYTLPERVLAMDVKYPLLVVATADKKVTIFNLDNPATPHRVLPSPFKMNVKSVRAFHNRQCFALGSIEGRIAIRYVDEAADTAQEPDGRNKNAFMFKCHRDGAMIYSINAVDTHPAPEFQGVLASAGSDGSYSFWDKDQRNRTREAKAAPLGQPISAAAWNPSGDLFAYAKSYDWSKGGGGYDLAKEPTRLFVHHTTDKDLRVPPKTR